MRQQAMTQTDFIKELCVRYALSGEVEWILEILAPFLGTALI
jgi:hypothetical protein